MQSRYFFLLILYLSLGDIALAQFQHNGSTMKLGDSCYVFRWHNNFTRGSIWKLEQISFDQSFDLSTRIKLGCDDSDGDGLVFGFQSLGTFIGNYTGHLGYAGISPSFGIELDTHQDPQHGDPAFDHMAIVMDGITDHNQLSDLPSPVRILEGKDDIEDCLFHHFRVTWNVESNTLRAYFDCQLRITLDLSNLAILEDYSEVFWGFTGGTANENIEFIVCPDYLVNTDQTGDYYLCSETELQLTAPFTGVSYTWSPGKSLSDSTVRSPVVTLLTNTLYTVQIKDSCGVTYEERIPVFVIDSPGIKIDFEDTLLCRGETLSIDLSHPNATYAWSHGPDDPIVEIREPGYYHVTVTSDGCTSENSFRVSTMQENQLLNIGGDTVLCQGELLMLRAEIPGKYLWQDGTDSRTHLVREPGVYSVQIENRCGIFSTSREVYYEDCQPLFFPNGFTPNGDGVNDTFLPFTNRPDVQIINFSIFNRWGNLVYSIDGVRAVDMTGWDGRANGKQLPEGVFTYRISVSVNNREPEVYWGNVTLIR